jgi:hypothetical protein
MKKSVKDIWNINNKLRNFMCNKHFSFIFFGILDDEVRKYLAQNENKRNDMKVIM